MSGSLKQVIQTGPSLVQATRSLADVRHRVGVYPYQWLIPGPDSKAVNAQGSGAMPGSYGTAGELVRYQVESGLRFSLRGIVLGSTSPDWEEASGNLIFSISVLGVGTRFVDDYASVDTRLGASLQPFPVDGRLEFQSNETVIVTATPVAVITLGVGGGFNFAKLLGHSYPNFEAGDD